MYLSQNNFEQFLR